MNLAVRNILKYLLQGVVILSPFLITLALTYYVFDFIDTIIPGMPRGTGFIVVIAFIMLDAYANVVVE